MCFTYAIEQYNNTHEARDLLSKVQLQFGVVDKPIKYNFPLAFMYAVIPPAFETESGNTSGRAHCHHQEDNSSRKGGQWFPVP